MPHAHRSEPFGILEIRQVPLDSLWVIALNSYASLRRIDEVQLPRSGLFDEAGKWSRIGCEKFNICTDGAPINESHSNELTTCVGDENAICKTESNERTQYKEC